MGDTLTMDRRALSFLALGLLGGVLLASAALIPSIRAGKAGSADRKIVLKLGHALDQQHPVHLGMAFMAKRLGEISGGTVELQIFPGGQLGTEPETIEQLQRGALAMVKTSTAALEGFVPEMAVFGLPYLFPDEAQHWRVLNGPIGRELLAAGEAHGIHGLCYYDSGSRSFYTIRKPILTPGDIKEMKLRVLPSKTARDLITMLGGGPTPVPFGELYTALQQGMVDGAENNPPSFLTSRHYEIARHYALDEHTRIPDMVIMSKPIWDRLSPEVRSWINQAAAESVDFQRTLWREKTEEALALVAKAGVTIHRPDKTAFVQATAPMYAALTDPRITELVRRIRDVR